MSTLKEKIKFHVKEAIHAILLMIVMPFTVAFMFAKCDCGCDPKNLDAEYKGWTVVQKESSPGQGRVNYKVTVTLGKETEEVRTFQYYYDKYALGAVVGEETALPVAEETTEEITE